MSDVFVPFDVVRPLVIDLLKTRGEISANIGELYLVRDLFGKVRLSVSDSTAEVAQDGLKRFAKDLHRALGVRGYPPEDAVVSVDQTLLAPLRETAQVIRPQVYWVERLLTGSNWWTVTDPSTSGNTRRFTLYSVKGGVGRSTTTAVLAWHLARKGERVLVIDLDLESPGLSSAMLGTRERPEFGITDWFVEDLIGQGDRVVDSMIAAPPWAHDFEGEVHIAPAHGREPGEYLAKLGRVYMDTPEPWTTRLERLLKCLEARCDASIVLLESRSGLHDIAAATVTDLNAEVLLFATDSASTWDDYDILFRHWQEHELATRIRERLLMVSALTPEIDTGRYLDGFMERSWNLFREHLYDETDANDDPVADRFSFDLYEEHAPHNPLCITWSRGLAAGVSLRDLAQTPVSLAYTDFLTRFDEIRESSVERRR